MKIVTAGAGEVGYHIVENLSGENLEFTVVDDNQVVLDKLADEFGVQTIHGNIIDKNVLNQIDLKHTDLFVAVTNSDQTNMIACKMASEQGVKKTICRVRQIDLTSQKKKISLKSLGIDLIINPVLVVAEEINRLIFAPNSVARHDFFGDKVNLIGFKINPPCSFIGKTIREVEPDLQKIQAQIAILQRKELTTVPSKETCFEEGDILYFFCPSEHFSKLRKILHYSTKKVKKVFISGGGQIGFLLAKILENTDIEVKVIESDLQQCHRLSDQLEKALVLNFDGTDTKKLQSEGVINADFFIAVTNNDKVNLTSCLLVHQYAKLRSICLVKEKEYISILDAQTPISLGISPRVLTAGNISRLIHGENILSYFKIANSQTEVIEIELPDTFSAFGLPIHELEIPEDVLIGMILRDGKIILPKGDFRLQRGDSLLVLLHRMDQKQVHQYFLGRDNHY